MAIGKDTFSAGGGAVSDLFQGIGAMEQGAIKAKGLRLTAQGTRLSAEGLRIKAEGDIAESSNYDLAAGLADKNAAYTEQSQRIQQLQLDREIGGSIGKTTAAVAAAGFSSGGSAGDLLRDSASQGHLAKDVLAQQGQITEAGYEEQAQAYRTMATTGRDTAAGEQDIATKTDAIAGEQDRLALDTQNAANNQAIGDFISAGIKGASAVASLMM